MRFAPLGGLSFGPVPPDALLGYNYIDCTLIIGSGVVPATTLLFPVELIQEETDCLPVIPALTPGLCIMKLAFNVVHRRISDWGLIVRRFHRVQLYCYLYLYPSLYLREGAGRVCRIILSGVTPGLPLWVYLALRGRFTRICLA